MESSTATVRARSLSVRFEDSCILIPPSDPPKSSIRPRLIRKSYSLPLWKTVPSKKMAPPSLNSLGDAESQPTIEDKAGKKPFSLTVSIPSLTAKSKSRRPSLPRSPCLAKRSSDHALSLASQEQDISPSASPSRRPPSFPAIQPANLTEAATVPLRACCVTCHRCVDASLAKGEHWNVKWSSGAKRRYSEGEQSRTRPVFGVTRVWTPTGVDVPLAAALQVDEVELKRRALEDSNNNMRCIEEDALADSDEEDPSPLPGPASPIPVPEEEDENMLFPLPSPRRTPNSSPYGTPQSGSQVSLAVPARVEGGFPTPTSLTFLSPACLPHSESAPPKFPSSCLPPASPVELPEHRVSIRRTQRQHSASQSRSASQPRRTSSFTSASGLFKGSAAMLKGVAAGMTGVGTGVVR